MTLDDPLFFDGPEAFQAWLEEHGEHSDGIWVRIAKKHTGVASLDWARAVDVVLCFGWIDGQSRRVDDDWYVQRFTPRRPRSVWSKVNRRKAEALIAAGRMRPAGLAEIERARADGRWDAAYDGMATAAPPDDLAAALERAGLTAAFADHRVQRWPPDAGSDDRLFVSPPTYVLHRLIGRTTHLLLMPAGVADNCRISRSSDGGRRGWQGPSGGVASRSSDLSGPPDAMPGVL